MKSRFDERKSTQIAGALLQLDGGKMNYMKLIKLLDILRAVGREEEAEEVAGELEDRNYFANLLGART